MKGWRLWEEQVVPGCFWSFADALCWEFLKWLRAAALVGDQGYPKPFVTGKLKNCVCESQWGSSKKQVILGNARSAEAAARRDRQGHFGPRGGGPERVSFHQKSFYNLMTSDKKSEKFFKVLHDRMKKAQQETKSTVSVNMSDIGNKPREDKDEPEPGTKGTGAVSPRPLGRASTGWVTT